MQINIESPHEDAKLLSEKLSELIQSAAEDRHTRPDTAPIRMDYILDYVGHEYTWHGKYPGSPTTIRALVHLIVGYELLWRLFKESAPYMLEPKGILHVLEVVKLALTEAMLKFNEDGPDIPTLTAPRKVYRNWSWVSSVEFDRYGIPHFHIAAFAPEVAISNYRFTGNGNKVFIWSSDQYLYTIFEEAFIRLLKGTFQLPGYPKRPLRGLTLRAFRTRRSSLVEYVMKCYIQTGVDNILEFPVQHVNGYRLRIQQHAHWVPDQNRNGYPYGFVHYLYDITPFLGHFHHYVGAVSIATLRAWSGPLPMPSWTLAVGNFVHANRERVRMGNAELYGLQRDAPLLRATLAQRLGVMMDIEVWRKAHEEAPFNRTGLDLAPLPVPAYAFDEGDPFNAELHGEFFDEEFEAHADTVDAFDVTDDVSDIVIPTFAHYETYDHVGAGELTDEVGDALGIDENTPVPVSPYDFMNDGFDWEGKSEGKLPTDEDLQAIRRQEKAMFGREYSVIMLATRIHCLHNKRAAIKIAEITQKIRDKQRTEVLTMEAQRREFLELLIGSDPKNDKDQLSLNMRAWKRYCMEFAVWDFTSASAAYIHMFRHVPSAGTLRSMREWLEQTKPLVPATPNLTRVKEFLDWYESVEIPKQKLVASKYQIEMSAFQSAFKLWFNPEAPDIEVLLKWIRVHFLIPFGDIPNIKPNNKGLMLIAPSNSGKTLFMKTIFTPKVPFRLADGTIRLDPLFKPVEFSLDKFQLKDVMDPSVAMHVLSDFNTFRADQLKVLQNIIDCSAFPDIKYQANASTDIQRRPLVACVGMNSVADFRETVRRVIRDEGFVSQFFKRWMILTLPSVVVRNGAPRNEFLNFAEGFDRIFGQFKEGQFLLGYEMKWDFDLYKAYLFWKAVMDLIDAEAKKELEENTAFQLVMEGIIPLEAVDWKVARRVTAEKAFIHEVQEARDKAFLSADTPFDLVKREVPRDPEAGVEQAEEEQEFRIREGRPDSPKIKKTGRKQQKKD